MRRAFTLIELMIVIFIVAIFAAIAIPSSVERQEAQKQANPAPAKVDVTIGTNIYKAQKFDLDGHSYFLINHEGWHGFTAVHNPDCAKCKPVVKVTAEKVEQ